MPGLPVAGESGLGVVNLETKATLVRLTHRSPAAFMENSAPFLHRAEDCDGDHPFQQCRSRIVNSCLSKTDAPPLKVDQCWVNIRENHRESKGKLTRKGSLEHYLSIFHEIDRILASTWDLQVAMCQRRPNNGGLPFGFPLNATAKRYPQNTHTQM